MTDLELERIHNAIGSDGSRLTEQLYLEAKRARAEETRALMACYAYGQAACGLAFSIGQREPDALEQARAMDEVLR